MLGLIADSVIENFLVVLEQDFNPSKVVVAVSGAGEVVVSYSSQIWIWEDHEGGLE